VSLGIFGDIKPVGEGVRNCRRHRPRLPRTSAARCGAGHPAVWRRQALGMRTFNGPRILAD
jgi:hypothetical protein